MDSTAAQGEAAFVEAGVQLRAGNFEDAERLYRAVLEVAPRHAASLQMLGVICARSGRLEEAVALLQDSLAVEPANPGANYNLANALAALGRDEAAILAYRRSLMGRSDYPPAWINLAAALVRTGAFEAAERAAGEAVRLAPDHPVAHRGLGDARRGLGQHLPAANAYERALALNPADAAACCNLGQALQDAGRYDEALAAYRRALGLELRGAPAWVALAGALRELGESADAITALDRALAIDPASARAWYVRSGLKSFAAGDAEIGRMEALLGEAEARAFSHEDRLDLEFAVGKAWMDVGDPDRAFAHLDAGNRRKRAALAYDVQDDIAALDAVAGAFTPGLLRRLEGAGAPSDRPVFVVGMPRSGTTLVEQILASHPDIHGAGELTLLDASLNRVLSPAPWAAADISAEAVGAVGRAYVEGLAAIAPAWRRVVDKLPANFRHAGLIAAALPNARIIHCRRDPIDACLSCYASKLVGRVDFASDLAELGLYQRAYQRLMDHWRALLPADRFIEVDYEALVGNLETEARRLIAFCGLAWDEACLSFHATRRDIRTASAAQARRPIYRTSVARWKPYAAHLRPLLEALGETPT